jgi:hypothetical protein
MLNAASKTSQVASVHPCRTQYFCLSMCVCLVHSQSDSDLVVYVHHCSLSHFKQHQRHHTHNLFIFGSHEVVANKFALKLIPYTEEMAKLWRILQLFIPFHA